MKKVIVVCWGVVVFLWFFSLIKLSAKGTEQALSMWEKIPPVKDRVEAEQFTKREKQILIRIATAEAEGEGVEGMRKVLEVVLNRAESPAYPDSIEEVVFQDYPCVQFESTQNGSYEHCEITDDAIEAFERISTVGVQDKRIVAYETVGNGDKLSKWYEYLYTVGHHRFYCEKGGENG